MKWSDLFKRKDKSKPQENTEPIDFSLNASTTSHICGLYFMRTMSVMDGREVYAVKVGQSGDISKRMSMYRTHTPFAVLGGICEIKHSMLAHSEEACHMYLHRYALPQAYCSGEWEIVSKENYELLCSQCDTDEGFKEFVGRALVA